MSKAEKSGSVMDYTTGIDPHRWYDTNGFCECLGIARHARLSLQNELRHYKDAISNGHSFIAEGSVLLSILRAIQQKGDRK